MEIQQFVQLLLNEYGLLIADRVYEFCELEVYLNSEEHPDPTVHCHPVQKRYGTWYFHRASSKPGAKYRGGTFKGLDIVFGDESCYFGVLIRSIYSKHTGMITGPCLVVNHILDRYNVGSIEDLLYGNPDVTMSFTDNFRKLHVIPNKAELEQIYRGPRIGLKEGPYAELPYRFVRRMKLVKKNKRGLTAC